MADGPGPSASAVTEAAADEQPWLAILNPAAGNARSHRSWPLIEQALRTAGVRFDTVPTRSPRSGQAIAATAVREGRRRLLVAGGDGSVHDVINGIFAATEAGALTAPVTLGAIPLGTGNDWARSLGMPRAPDEIAAVVRRNRLMTHDVGRIDFSSTHCWFINVAGAGFDAHVIARLPARLPSRLTYIMGALGALLDYRAPHFEIETTMQDAGHHASTRVQGRHLLVFVANGRYCGHRMDIAPTALPDDGIFEVVAIAEVSLAEALLKLPKLYRGTLAGDPVMRHERGSIVHIGSVPSAPVEADGQLVGATPATFSVLPKALRVLVP